MKRGYVLSVSQSVNRWTFSILEEQTLLGLFLDQFEMSGVALLPHAWRGGPVLNVARKPRLFALDVQVVFRLVAWCRTTRRGGSGWMRIGVKCRDAVKTKGGNSAQEGVSPDGSAKVFAWVLFLGGSGRRGRGSTNDAGRVKRSHWSGSSGGSQGGRAPQHHADGGCGDHVRSVLERQYRWILYTRRQVTTNKKGEKAPRLEDDIAQAASESCTPFDFDCCETLSPLSKSVPKTTCFQFAVF